MRVDDFQDQQHSAHRHIVVFETTTEPNGFAQLNTDQVGDIVAWEFAVAERKPWRVIGFIIDPTSYTVWLVITMLSTAGQR